MAATSSKPRKRPFDIDEALILLRQAVGPLPKSSMFEHVRAGHTTLFEILVACIVSTRTNEKIAVEAVRRLFAVARTPQALAALPEAEIDRLITPVTFHAEKSSVLRELAQKTVRNYRGELPANPKRLQMFRGVGFACSKMAVGISRGEYFEGSDEDIARVVYRWGYAKTTKPEATMELLKEKVPHSERLELKALLVPFGKYLCTQVEPHCSTCQLLPICRQVGVTSHK